LKPWLGSVSAVIAGFIATALASTASIDRHVMQVHCGVRRDPLTKSATVAFQQLQIYAC
jgi:hypothetical protein